MVLEKSTVVREEKFENQLSILSGKAIVSTAEIVSTLSAISLQGILNPSEEDMSV